MTNVFPKKRHDWSAADRLKKIFFLMLFLLCTATYAGGKKTAVEQPLRVQFQMKAESGGAWTTSSAVLKGAAKESMLKNQLMSRWPRHQIRILAVDTGVRKSYSVQYQLSRDGKSWSTGSAVLQNSLTQSMARNQIAQRHPGMRVRILSMNRL